MIIPFLQWYMVNLKFTFTSGVLLGPGSIVVDCDVCWAKHLSWELGIQTYTSHALYSNVSSPFQDYTIAWQG